MERQPQHSAIYRKQRAAFKAKHRVLNSACHICNGELGPIDYDAQPQTSKAFELDHIKPKATHPHLFYDEANWAPSHCGCNRSRQAGELKPKDPSAGRWVKADW
jgi:hypothetical protein